MKAAIRKRKPDGKVENLALLAEDHDEATREILGLVEDRTIKADEEVIAILQ